MVSHSCLQHEGKSSNLFFSIILIGLGVGYGGYGGVPHTVPHHTLR